MNKVIFLLILSLVLLPLHVIAAVGLGSWTPIKDVKDPHVVKIGEFAVSEYDKETRSRLTLVKVVKGESQLVPGMNSRLLLKVNGSDTSEYYVAIVLEKPWLKSMKLTFFTPVVVPAVASFN
ncbi:PREDICTED: cysteine proteinase inhibitor 5-like [Camelina sativa]|uniref:Cysteine proteinase inhibitor 5-like n=1 Tax=Camelina sativa TaxID=90675 RepID=A0ABM0ZB71_CAMSA|nr:PREDICTED: cysteine proteinase inhibitor 5-like [Camelina sativa]